MAKVKKDVPGEIYDIQSVKDALKLLKELSYIGTPTGPRELARATGFNTNKVFRLLKTMLGEGFIEKHSDKYGLGYSAAEVYAKYVRAIKKVRDDADLKLSNLGENE